MAPTREEKEAARAEYVRAFLAADDAAERASLAVLRAWAERNGVDPAGHGSRRGKKHKPETLAKIRAAGARRRRANIERRLAAQ
jgi:hypothetical protein